MATAFWWLVTFSVIASYGISDIGETQEYDSYDDDYDTIFENVYGPRGTAAVGANKAAAAIGGVEL